MSIGIETTTMATGRPDVSEFHGSHFVTEEPPNGFTCFFEVERTGAYSTLFADFDSKIEPFLKREYDHGMLINGTSGRFVVIPGLARSSVPLRTLFAMPPS